MSAIHPTAAQQRTGDMTSIGFDIAGKASLDLVRIAAILLEAT
jgi:hypothetical protein